MNLEIDYNELSTIIVNLKENHCYRYDTFFPSEIKRLEAIIERLEALRLETLKEHQSIMRDAMLSNLNK